MAHPTFELTRIAQIDAARAEAAWLAGDRDAVAQITDAALALAVDRRDSWAAGELTYWRHRAGIQDELPAGLVAEPYRLSISGDWARAAERWRQIGCPYETALALADADDESALQQAFEGLQALGARPAVAIVARRLRERGVRGIPRGPRPRTRENPAGLTTRETEVLRWWQRDCATRRSPSGSSYRRRQSITTSQRSCANSTCGHAVRRAQRQHGSESAST